jgi:hypothetical protein
MNLRERLAKYKGQNEDPKNSRLKAITYWAVAFAVLILFLSMVLLATRPAQEPAFTPDISATLEKALADALGPPTASFTPSLSPTTTQTPTITRTPFPTLTGTPTLTSTLTATALGTLFPPTLTPILPNNVNDAFQLVRLSAIQYKYAVALMEGVPNLLEAGSENQDYYPSFYHAEIIQSEAALRYPDSQDTVDWRWSEALNLAKIKDPRATLAYATLLTRLITEEGYTLQELLTKVQDSDSRLKLILQEAAPYPGNLQNYLLELQTPGGSVFLWFTETNERKTIYTLSDETNFADPRESKLLWVDLSGDGNKELAIFTPSSEFRQRTTPRVFDLTQSPPQQLHFKPDEEFKIGLENTHNWTIVSNEQDYFDLAFEATAYPPCPVTINQVYHWSGEWFERLTETFQVQPVSQLIEYCELLVDQASSVWGIPAKIQIMESLLPYWPPQSTSKKTYPLDALDQWLYRLGVYHALVGNAENARAYFDRIINTPVAPESRWITPARDFLKLFETPWGLYQACVASELCDNRIALKNWVATLTPEEAQNALFYLSARGVAIRYSNVFDFDEDGNTERWFTLRHSYLDRLELWILLSNENGAQALFVDTVDTNQPTLTRYTDLNGQIYVWIGSQQSFRLLRYSYSDQAFIELLPPSYYPVKLTNQLAEHALDALLAGFSPKDILDELLSHRESKNFICLTKEECARFYYALGLAAELAGENALAVESYLKIWWDSFESPFTTIVRLKLAFKPGYGPINTATPVPTLAPTWTPTRTPTPTPSKSPTPTGSITTTISPTPTGTSTMDPNMTWTPSPTPSDTPTPSATPTPTNTSESYP